MRRLFFIIMAVSFCLRLSAQSVTLNIDKEMLAEYGRGYAAELASEMMNDESIGKILNHYSSAEVATAGIFSSKWLDRQAMKNAGPFGSMAENYYYQRIWNMVQLRILPKIWDVASLMIHYPERALYWGPYLFKTCEDVKMLCATFAAVVTNCRLTFQDILFYSISDDLKELFDLTRLGEVDWKALWEHLGDFGDGITKEAIKEDIENLMTAGRAIASAGSGVVSDTWSESSKVVDIFRSKPAEIIALYDNFRGIYEVVNDPMRIKDMVMEKLMSTDSTGVSRLLTAEGYNLTTYISDYLQELQGRYYTQQWTIREVTDGSGGDQEQIFDYQPTFDGDCIAYKVGDSPNMDQVFAATEAYCRSKCPGYYTRQQINQMNAAGDGCTYSINYTGVSQPVYSGNSVVAVKFAIAIQIYRRCSDSGEVFYEELLDTYKDSEATMQARFDGMLAKLNDPDQDKRYMIVKGEKHYYDAADERRLKGCAMVSFSMECHDKSSLGEGTFSWKENGEHPHDYLDITSKGYAMETSLGNSQVDLERIYDYWYAADEKYMECYDEIRTLEDEVNYYFYRSTHSHWAARYTEEEIRNSQIYDSLYNVLQEAVGRQQMLADTANAYRSVYDAALDDYNDEDDAHYRIPAVMHELEAAYGVQWDESGGWVSSTRELCVFERVGHIPNVNGEVTFRAELTLQRPESHHWLIGRYHRAILAVHWTFGSDYSTESIADYMELDPSNSDSENVDIVNGRLRELMEENPGCDIEVNYAKSSPDQVEDDDEAFHLLWVSDRLRVARDVDARLSKIYAELVLVEKFMRQRMELEEVMHSLLGLGGIGDNLRSKVGRRSFRRWFRAACSASTGQSLLDLMEHYPDDDEE